WAHLNDLLAQRWPGESSARGWETDFATHEQTDSETDDAPPPEAEPTAGGHRLPHSAELGRCYRVLDLPFGAPMEQVTRRWKACLNKEHPDRHANDPAKQAEATILTQQLNDAHQKIKLAWERHRR